MQASKQSHPPAQRAHGGHKHFGDVSSAAQDDPAVQQSAGRRARSGERRTVRRGVGRWSSRLQHSAAVHCTASHRHPHLPSAVASPSSSAGSRPGCANSRRPTASTHASTSVTPAAGRRTAPPPKSTAATAAAALAACCSSGGNCSSAGAPCPAAAAAAAWSLSWMSRVSRVAAAVASAATSPVTPRGACCCCCARCADPCCADPAAMAARCCCRSAAAATTAARVAVIALASCGSSGVSAGRPPSSACPSAILRHDATSCPRRRMGGSRCSSRSCSGCGSCSEVASTAVHRRRPSSTSGSLSALPARAVCGEEMEGVSEHSSSYG